MRTKTVVQALIVLIAMTGIAIADDRSPASPSDISKTITPNHSAVPQIDGVIKAVVVKSWSGCSSGSVVWDDLNANWASYGSTPIFIDYSYPGLCDGPITYAGLVASGANVVLISDPSGGGQQYSIDEINAIRQYAADGHNVIGTYLLLQYSPVDNRGLADIFGLRSDLNYNTVEEPFVNVYNILEPTNPLFKNIAGTYDSQGYPNTQIPVDLSWNASDLNGARYVARGTDNKAVITIYDTPNYSAVYITSMPEFNGGTEDKQFLYNAIVYKALPSVSFSVSTDKSVYAPGETVQLKINITNPTTDTYSSKLALDIYWPSGIGITLLSKAFTMTPGLSVVKVIPIPIPNSVFVANGDYKFTGTLTYGSNVVTSTAPFTITRP